MIKYNFFFDYIYYRMNKAYFKWDGRNGNTSIIGISMIQILIFVDVYVFITLLFYERKELIVYLNYEKWIVTILFAAIVLYNFKKFKNKYNKYRFYWKDEDKKTRIIKGILVILSLAIPWVPLILMGVFWK